MKDQELKEALRLIGEVLNNPSVEPNEGDQLRKAKREFEAVAHAGKLDRRKLFRAVRIVSQVLKNLVK